MPASGVLTARCALGKPMGEPGVNGDHRLDTERWELLVARDRANISLVEPHTEWLPVFPLSREPLLFRT